MPYLGLLSRYSEGYLLLPGVWCLVGDPIDLPFCQMAMHIAQPRLAAKEVYIGLYSPFGEHLLKGVSGKDVRAIGIPYLLHQHPELFRRAFPTGQLTRFITTDHDSGLGQLGYPAKHGERHSSHVCQLKHPIFHPRGRAQ